MTVALDTPGGRRAIFADLARNAGALIERKSHPPESCSAEVAEELKMGEIAPWKSCGYAVPSMTLIQYCRCLQSEPEATPLMH